MPPCLGIWDVSPGMKRLIVSVAAVGVCAGLTSCSTTASPSTTTTSPKGLLGSTSSTTTPDQGTAAALSRIIGTEVLWVRDAEDDANRQKIPSVYEKTTSAAQSAASQLRSLSIPATDQTSVTALVAALQKVSADSALALPVGADVAAVAQLLEKDQSVVFADTNQVLRELGSRTAFVN
jgi:hypothetical protein